MPESISDQEPSETPHLTWGVATQGHWVPPPGHTAHSCLSSWLH